MCATATISILRSGEKGRARVIQLVISIVFQAKLKTPLFPSRQPCNQFVSSPRGSPRVRTPANCPRTLFHAQKSRVHTRVYPCRPRSSAILGTNAPGRLPGGPWDGSREAKCQALDLPGQSIILGCITGVMQSMETTLM